MSGRWQEAQALRRLIEGYEQRAGQDVDHGYVMPARQIADQVDLLTSGEQIAKPGDPSDEFLAQVVKEMSER